MCIIIVHTQPKRKRAHPFVALVFGFFRKFFLQTTCAASCRTQTQDTPPTATNAKYTFFSIWIWFGWSDRLNGCLPCSFVRTKLGQSSMIELICTQSLLGWLQTYNNAFYFRCELIERKDETTNYLIFLSTFFASSFMYRYSLRATSSIFFIVQTTYKPYPGNAFQVADRATHAVFRKRIEV